MTLGVRPPSGRSILQECCALVEAPPIQAGSEQFAGDSGSIGRTKTVEQEEDAGGVASCFGEYHRIVISKVCKAIFSVMFAPFRLQHAITNKRERLPF